MYAGRLITVELSTVVAFLFCQPAIRGSKRFRHFFGKTSKARNGTHTQSLRPLYTPNLPNVKNPHNSKPGENFFKPQQNQSSNINRLCSQKKQNTWTIQSQQQDSSKAQPHSSTILCSFEAFSESLPPPL